MALDYAFGGDGGGAFSACASSSIRSRNILHDGWRVGWMVVRNRWCGRPNDCSKILPFRCRRVADCAAEAAFEGRLEMEDVKRGYQRIDAS